jgi:multisubunit Na+/H+ antiporter MnhE subunit
MATFFKKLIPHNIAAIIGIIQLIIPLIKEIIIAVIRIIDILTPDKGLEPVIVRVSGIFKNMFLGL